MKRFGKAICVFLPFVLLLAGVNYYADPANILRGGYEQKVAQIMASGANAGNLRNMDDRSFMKAYAALRTQPVDTLVLGSSHAMQITHELTGDENTFCAGVTGADLRDCISIYRLFRAQGFSPKCVILVIDYRFLCDNTLESRAMTDGYRDFCKENGFVPVGTSAFDFALPNWERISQIVSIPYFQQSLDALKKGQHKTRDPVATQARYAETENADMRRADGSYSYNATLRAIDPDPQKTYERAYNDILVKPGFAHDFTSVTPALQEQLEAFITSMQEDGVQVALMLAPFHPDYYEHMRRQTDNYVDILATENVVRALAETCGVQLFGSYDPAACGLTAVDFYDAFHCTEESMYKFYPQHLFTA